MANLVNERSSVSGLESKYSFKDSPHIAYWKTPVMMLRLLASVFLSVSLIGNSCEIGGAADPILKLKQRDHISYIGNTLADRMQHAGWLETYIHAAYPNMNLTVRNLGFSGDEVKLRPREDNFGSPDEWLTKNKSNIVFAFFGYNEALRGQAGLDSFKKELSETIDGMLVQKYDGVSAPQLVFFSPIAH